MLVKSDLKIMRQYVRHPTEYSIFRMLYNFILTNVSKDAAICEVGCGLGNCSNFLFDLGYHNVTAIDSSPYLDKLENKGVKFLNVNIEEFSKSHKEKFDLVICIGVVEHIKEDKIFFEEVTSIIKKEGHLIMVTPGNPFLYSYIDVNYGHYRRYEKSILKSYFDYNYEDVDMRMIGRYFLLKLVQKLQFKNQITHAENMSSTLLENNTKESFELHPPKFFWKIKDVLPYLYFSTYIIDLLFSKTKLGTEFFIAAKKRGD